MGYYRVRFEGYIEGEYDSADLAKQEMVAFLEDGIDAYGRSKEDLIVVEEYDPVEECWK